VNEKEEERRRKKNKKNKKKEGKKKTLEFEVRIAIPGRNSIDDFFFSIATMSK